jgi:hypothetical protein
LIGLSAELLIVVLLKNSLSFPKIQSGGSRGVRENQRIIRCDICDHRVYPDEAHRRA